MTIGEAVKERIFQLCAERDLTINKLSTISGVTQSTVNNVVGGRNNSTTVSTIQKLCDQNGADEPRSCLRGLHAGCVRARFRQDAACQRRQNGGVYCEYFENEKRLKVPIFDFFLAYLRTIFCHTWH